MATRSENNTTKMLVCERALQKMIAKEKFPAAEYGKICPGRESKKGETNYENRFANAFNSILDADPAKPMDGIRPERLEEFQRTAKDNGIGRMSSGGSGGSVWTEADAARVDSEVNAALDALDALD